MTWEQAMREARNLARTVPGCRFRVIGWQDYRGRWHYDACYAGLAKGWRLP